MPLVFSPGNSTMYSTGNSIVLGAIVEKISGLNFQQYVQQLFIDPLRLNYTNFKAYWTLDDSQTGYAIGYEKTGDTYRRKPYQYNQGFVTLSAGGMWSSVTDLY